MTTNGKPVNVRRGVFGTWFATRGEREVSPGVFEATSRFPISAESAEQLEELYDSHGWVEALLRESGKTRAEVAEALGLGELTPVEPGQRVS